MLSWLEGRVLAGVLKDAIMAMEIYMSLLTVALSHDSIWEPVPPELTQKLRLQQWKGYERLTVKLQ